MIQTRFNLNEWLGIVLKGIGLSLGVLGIITVFTMAVTTCFILIAIIIRILEFAMII